MKNVHVLSTDKLIKSAGDLVKDKYGSIHIFTKNDGKEYGKTTTKLNIYITDNSEIKEGNYVVVSCSEIEIEEVRLVIGYYNEQFLFDDRGQIHMDYCKKIILTTDPQLIADGVQPIDNEFLEWFVKNPSCEFVETQCSGRNCIEDFGCTKEGCNGVEPLEIIIPQETIQQFIEKHGITEQQLIDGYKQGLDLIFENASKITKQETLEEAAEKEAECRYPVLTHPSQNNSPYTASKETFKHGVRFGANWQAERMYSEEEVKLISFSAMDYKQDRIINYTEKVKWFDQFKKK
jgi:hypothetical protein